ncbi:LysM peptidoglycan-binding domain-containing protein [Gracilibacillus salitolerans]|uniref:LysM peptidoglycan-binding domain-containing protein n=1 Tax=Gracilibacillus salitolerans TaxID=2663022 RepID=A0A5Q2TJJ2_9BACI|nr:CAP domain-containing protein [Gracilibacillus salitolerans]QGH34876.1 LysM peptidoglycan-binding domain-containing protein [Gracilibacillus salitolerans]
MKRLVMIILTLFLLLFPLQSVFAATHIVQQGESLWKISLQYKIGLSEIIEVNEQIENPDLIYPKQRVTIPTKDEIKSIEHQVIQYTNQEREKNGLAALKPDWQLSRVARYKSQDMQQNNYFSHQSPTYGSPFNMMRDFGINYRSAAENIAKGQETPYQVVQAWMNSSGHRANILNDSYTHIGVGYVRSGNYWTQMFMTK